MNHRSCAAVLPARCRRARTGPLISGHRRHRRAEIAVLETTDIHSNMLSYDYLQAR